MPQETLNSFFYFYVQILIPCTFGELGDYHALIYCVRGSGDSVLSQTGNPGSSFTNLYVMESDGLNY